MKLKIGGDTEEIKKKITMCQKESIKLKRIRKIYQSIEERVKFRYEAVKWSYIYYNL